uniref:Plac8 onzin related protein 2 n=2 Tax=Oryzias melastigma TaxID=30732 RepID=A0A3B3E250_ORYME
MKEDKPVRPAPSLGGEAGTYLCCGSRRGFSVLPAAVTGDQTLRCRTRTTAGHPLNRLGLRDFPTCISFLPDVIMSKLVISQPQPVMESRESQEWSSGVCDCFQDVPQCCFAFWCFPCFACINSRKFGEALCLPLLEMFFGGSIPPITLATRVSMRHRYGIKGTICVDCVYSTFCTPCVWCQMAREMKRREISVVMINAKTT